MKTEQGLWATSPAWRWTFSITALLTGIVFLIGPWRNPVASLPALATYQTPTPNLAIPSQRSVAPGAIPSVARPNPTGGRNPAFDVGRKSGISALPPGTELHVIGVHQGALPDGQKESPWWAKCTEFKADNATMRECHTKFATQVTSKKISIEVTRSGTPQALVLMSYEPVIWQLSIGSRTRIAKVILAGYHGQDIEGLPDNIPVEARTYEPSSCRNCSRQSDHFYAYKQDSKEFENASDRIKKITGISPHSFQGAYKANRFAVSDSTVGGRPLSAARADNGDIYSGKSFTDEIVIGGHAISLPSGTWQGLSYLDGGTRGQNQLVTLGKFENRQVRELIAIRIQVIPDGSGFPKHSGCQSTADHAAVSTSNESFGRQACYNVTHVTDAWSQPLLAAAANRIAAQGANPPDVVIASNFHGANQKRSIDLMHYAIPDIRLVVANDSWESSSWHKMHLKKESEQARFVQDEVKWAENWYQIFRLSL